MSPLRKIIILIVLIFFGLLIIKLMNKRAKLLHETFEVFATKEGEMSKFNINKELPQNTVGTITNFSSQNNLSLKEYCIMSSRNTAKTGSYMNTEMIKYVLSRGCRLLDFEIYEFDDVPYVAYSTDGNSRYIETKNKILLDDALKTVAQYGFAAPSPNPNDPLFIQLRIRINKITDKMYQIIGTTVRDNLGQRLMSGKVSGQTPIFNLREKIIIILDRENQTPHITPNIVGNSNELPTDYYDNVLALTPKPPIINADNLRTNIQQLTMTFASEGNPQQLNTIITKHARQFICYNFSEDTSEYETIFNDNGSAFVPFSQMIPYIQKKM
jgi:hypothetical protein